MPSSHLRSARYLDAHWQALVDERQRDESVVENLARLRSRGLHSTHLGARKSGLSWLVARLIHSSTAEHSLAAQLGSEASVL